MKKYTSTLIPLFLLMIVHGAANAKIISVSVESTAEGFILDYSKESTELNRYTNTQISEQFGSKVQGSAVSLDAVSDIAGDDILFKNGNASYGVQSSSSTRTVVDIEFQNTASDAITPTLQSQILPAGLGLFLSDCDALNLRVCNSFDDLLGFSDLQAFAGDDGTIMSANFDFSVLLEGVVDPLFALSGSLALNYDSDTGVTVSQELSEAEGFLTDFAKTSDDTWENQLTFDWSATNFEVLFPVALQADEIAKLSYVVEVSTFTSSNCVDLGQNACPLAYAAFGDPIGRGGAAGPRSVNITGYEPALFTLKAPTFENGVLNFVNDREEEESIPPPVEASAPSILTLILIGIAYIGSRRKLHLM